MLAVIAKAFRIVPQNLLSYSTGCLVRVRLPQPVASWVCQGFASAFDLDLSEAGEPLASYATIEDLFTRTLKPGLRPVTGPVCSPADGYLARSEAAEAGKAVQAKGLDYDLADLVHGNGPRQAGTAERLAWYQTVYLAPHNYHRVHAPFSGAVGSIRYIPGDLWPVNGPFVARVPRLFARNERLVFTFDLDGGGRAYVVMVGAFNVGRMVTPLAPTLVSNSVKRQLGPRQESIVLAPARHVTIGDEIGTFMLGSTVVIVYDETALRSPGLAGKKLLRADDHRPLRMGESLCT